jgi:hypothetical protein
MPDIFQFSTLAKYNSWFLLSSSIFRLEDKGTRQCSFETLETFSLLYFVKETPPPPDVIRRKLYTDRLENLTFYLLLPVTFPLHLVRKKR